MTRDATGMLWDAFLAYLTEHPEHTVADFTEWARYRASKWHLVNGRPHHLEPDTE